MSRFTHLLLFWLGNVAPEVRVPAGLLLGALLLYWFFNHG